MKVSKSNLMLVAVILFAAWMLYPFSTGTDESYFSTVNPGAQPVHIMSDTEAAAVYRGSGEGEVAGCLRAFWRILPAAAGDGEESAFGHIAEEAIRYTELIEESYELPARARLLKLLARDRGKMNIYIDSEAALRRCRRKIYQEGDRSPETGEILVDAIRRLEEAGLGTWAGDYYETAADYNFATGRDAEAFEYLRASLDSHIEASEYAGASRIAGRAGVYQVRKGELEDAGSFHMASLSFARLTDNSYLISRALHFLALCRGTEGYYMEAESLLTESLTYCDSAANPTCRPSKLLAFARIYNAFGETDRAERYAEETIFILEKTVREPGAEDSPYISQVRTYLAAARSLKARLLAKRGEIDNSLQLSRKALKDMKGSIDRQFEAELERYLGDACSRAGRWDEAAKCYSNAISISRSIRSRRRTAEYLTALGSMHLEHGLHDRARKSFEEAAEIARDEDYWMQAIETAHLLGQTAVAEGNSDEGRALFAMAVDLFEEYSSGPTFTEGRHAMAERIDQIYSGLFRISCDSPSGADSLVFWAERSRHWSEGTRLGGGSDFHDRIRACISARDWIPEGTAVIQYLVTDDETIIIVMDRHSIEHRIVRETRDELGRIVTGFIDLCESGGGKHGSEAIIAGSRRLYDLLIEPIAPLVAGRESLCFILDDNLHHLPFAALAAEDDPPLFLAERSGIWSAPHLIALSDGTAGRLRDTLAEDFRNPLLIGDVYMVPPVRKYYPYLSDLPYSGREIKTIQAFFPGSTTLTGRSATENAITRIAGSSDLVHIAAHTVHYPVYGSKTALVLAPAGEITGEKSLDASLLTEEEIRLIDLTGTRLVVLSSCESAKGKRTNRRGSAGLAGAFLEAGASSVLAALWPVEDSAAERLTTLFYREFLGSRSSPAEALRSVQIRFIDQGRAEGDPCRHIGTWAPFVVSGSAFERAAGTPPPPTD